ncbi:trypsin-like serine protease [Ornithinimicrobium cerasi]|uniref:trypsin-like serine protease n=1 Tax=Ornithinimicrobium cerasi TaxID=2248773 RepID=UPI000F00FC34|nr:trypsin-like serine protease [Ornithinimicrobium cerasi]
MRKNTLLAATAGLALVAGTAGPAAAIKYGERDNGKHPYVGLMLAYVEDPTGALQPAWRCTGTQMDADTFLTAGHCTFGADAVAIWFGEDLTDAAAVGYPDFGSADATGTPFTNPHYDDAAFYLHDVGVVQLDTPVNLDEYGELPELNYWQQQIDTRKKDRDSYTTVGYGLQWSMPDSNGQGRQSEALRVRLQAGGDLIGYRTLGGGKTSDAYVVLTNNASTGGTCSGDSGGPTFIEGTSTVVAVTSFGMNTTCAGTSGVYRIDTADDLAWLAPFIG